MKTPKYINGNGNFCAIVRVDFTITLEDIIMAIALILNEGEEPTVKNTQKMLKGLFKGEGEAYNIEGLYSYGIEDSHELEGKAKGIAKKLFPHWVQKQNNAK